MEVTTLILIYFVAINCIGFGTMGLDKLKAKKKLYRLSEAMLFWIAIIGGSIGSLIGMYTFRHKTKHLTFVIGIPLIISIQFILLFIIFKVLPIDIFII